MDGVSKRDAREVLLSRPQRRQPGHLVVDIEHAPHDAEGLRQRLGIRGLGRVPDDPEGARHALFDDGVEQALAGAKPVVHHRRGDAARSGDLRQRGVGDATLRDQRRGGVEQVRAGVVIGRAGAPARRGCAKRESHQPLLIDWLINFKARRQRMRRKRMRANDGRRSRRGITPTCAPPPPSSATSAPCRLPGAPRTSRSRSPSCGS